MKLRLLPFLVSALAVGMWAQAPPSGSPDSAVGPLADGGQQQRKRPDVVGKITAITDSTITVRTMDGKDATIQVTPKTEVHTDRKLVKLTDLAVGDGVMMRGRSVGTDKWEADMIGARGAGSDGGFMDALGKKFIVGEIKAMDGVKLTIARPDGQTQIIAVDENTSFKKEHESVTLGDFKVGDHVFGRGEVKDGTFVAATLALGDPRTMMGGPPSAGSGQPH